MIFSKNAGKELYAALSEAQNDIVPPKKDAHSDQFGGYYYTTLAQVIEEIDGIARSKGLLITQSVDKDDDGTDILMTAVAHIDSGQFLYSNCRLPLEKKTIQGLGSAITYMRRYQLMAIFMKASQDDDGAGASFSPSMVGRDTPTDLELGPGEPPSAEATQTLGPSSNRHMTPEGVLALLNNAKAGEDFEFVYRDNRDYMNSDQFESKHKAKAWEITKRKRAEAKRNEGN